jgi:hypothetical protein
MSLLSYAKTVSLWVLGLPSHLLHRPFMLHQLWRLRQQDNNNKL